jgi:hypothetical protein
MGAVTKGGASVSNPSVDDSLAGLEPEVDAFIRALLDRAAAIRLAALFQSRHPEALYWVGDRHGVTTVALRTTSLTEEQLVAIMTFRLAQYLMAHQLDPRLIYADQLAYEPLENVSDHDVHVVAGAAATGELLAYGTFKALVDIGPEVRMRDTNRPLFPVEEVFGRGVFDRLKILPDLPVRRVREAGRLMKSHRHAALDESAARAPVELLLAAFRLVKDGLHNEIDACIGDLEMGVAKKNQDFFHLPTVIPRGVVPYAPEGTYGYFNYAKRARYPYAFLSADISDNRLIEIERALCLPAKAGLVALLGLKHDASSLPSNLVPAGGLPELDDVPMAQMDLPMAARRGLLDVGEWLRSTTLFRDLTVSESAVLSTFLQRLTAEPGATIVQQGEVGDDVFVIEQGTADVFITAPDSRRILIRTMGPRDYFGEIALLSDGMRTADVVATSLLVLLRLTRADYERYLACMIEVEHDLTKTALDRTQATLRALRPAKRLEGDES